MAAASDHAPVWLFSFVDLAFLLLIAMTQIARQADVPELGELVVPRIRGEASAPLPDAAPDRWQLRVHPREGPDAAPFELVAPHGGGAERLDAEALRARLDGLEAQETARPLLAPHADSRSEDLLDAVALLEQAWPGRRRAAVAPWIEAMRP